MEIMKTVVINICTNDITSATIKRADYAESFARVN